MDRRDFVKKAGWFTVATAAGGSFIMACGNGEQASAPANGDGAATNGSGEATPEAAVDPSSLRNLVYVTPFQQILSHADVYVAIQEGYFAEEGMLITPIGGQGTGTSVSQVSADQGMFGKGASIITVPLVANGTADLVTVAQKDQAGQYDIASDPGSPLTSPQDLVDKIIGVISLGGTTELLLNAMLVAEGIDPTTVERVVTGADAASLEFLRRGEVAGFVTFIGTKTTFDLQGIDLNYLATNDYAPVPEDSYFITRRTAEEEGDAVVSFLRGCRRGWEFMADPDNTPRVLEAMAQFNPTEVQDEERAAAIVAAEVALATPQDSGSEFLDIDMPAWEQGLEIMDSLGLLEQDLPLEDYVTTEFIDQV